MPMPPSSCLPVNVTSEDIPACYFIWYPCMSLFPRVALQVSLSFFFTLFTFLSLSFSTASLHICYFFHFYCPSPGCCRPLCNSIHLQFLRNRRLSLSSSAFSCKLSPCFFCVEKTTTSQVFIFLFDRTWHTHTIKNC